MSVSFTEDSRFAPERSLTKVKFGAGAKYLEVEANELQDILNYARTRLLKLLIPSGMQSKGTLRVSGAADNICYVGVMDVWLAGYPIRFAYNGGVEDNKVTLSAPSNGRTDLIYAECWFEEIDKDDSVYNYGGEASGTLTNNMLDGRIGEETSRRVQLRWRMLAPTSVNFTTYPKGVNDPNIKARGATGSPTALTFSQDATDTGLFIAGTGSAGDKTTLGTYDGFSYALPLFKVTRTASATLTLGEFTDLRTDSVASSTAFGTIEVSGQSNVVADKVMDSLILAAGTNIVITTNPATDTVTIGVTGKLGDADTLDTKHASDFANVSHNTTHVGGGSDAIAAATTSVAGLMSAADKALVSQLFAQWEAKDIAGTYGNTNTDSTAFSGQNRSSSATTGQVFVDGTSSRKTLRFMPYVAIFRVKASTTGNAAVTLKIKQTNGSSPSDLATLDVTATQATTSWTYWKLPFTFATAGYGVYPEATYKTASATFYIDSIIILPNIGAFYN